MGTGTYDTALAQRITALEKTVTSLQAVVNADAMLYGPAFLRNAASEILLFAVERVTLSTHETYYFRVLAADRSAELSAVVRSLNKGLVAPTTEVGLARILDDLIEGRVRSVHHTDRHSLEIDALLPARDLLLRHPQLRAACPREVWVLDNYEAFQSAFGFL